MSDYAVIYALDGDGEIRYVGQTRSPRSRFRAHKWGAEARTRAWVRGLSGPLKMLTLDVSHAHNRGVLSVERRWVVQLMAQGHRLLNRVFDHQLKAIAALKQQRADRSGS